MSREKKRRVSCGHCVTPVGLCEASSLRPPPPPSEAYLEMNCRWCFYLASARGAAREGAFKTRPNGPCVVVCVPGTRVRLHSHLSTSNTPPNPPDKHVLSAMSRHTMPATSFERVRIGTVALSYRTKTTPRSVCCSPLAHTDPGPYRQMYISSRYDTFCPGISDACDSRHLGANRTDLFYERRRLPFPFGGSN